MAAHQGDSRYAFVEHNGNRLRLVVPYYYELKTKFKTKPKDSPKSVGDYVAIEMCTDPSLIPTAEEVSYVELAIKAGLVRVNGSEVEYQTMLKHNDLIWRAWHRHEPPVYDPENLVVVECKDFVVCNKPSTIPVHPADRLTSGLVVLAKNQEIARVLSDAFQNQNRRHVRKTYIARVTGKFPTVRLPRSAAKIKVFEGKRADQNRFCVTASLSEIDTQRGINAHDEEGKESVSEFEFIDYDSESNTSLVECEPLTGRTHQLRLHLQLLGYPIANDPNYGGVDTTAIASSDAIYFHDKCSLAIAQLSMDNNTADENVVNARNICVSCRQNFEAPRHPGIWLHSCRARFFEDDCLVYDLHVPLPRWASGSVADSLLHS